MKSESSKNYKLIDKLGGRDDIELVLDEEDKSVAVKKYLSVYDERTYERLRDLKNIHIPRLIDCWVEDGRLCLAEEYIQGETLEEMLERGHVFDDDEIREIALGIIDALGFLHAQTPPIIHRDIKLSNVMIDRDKVVKLIDFNAARSFDETLSRDTKLIGTAGYAAPEQYGFAQSDERTDIYALGVLINILLTGKAPGEELCPGPWRRIVTKCTYIDPDKRYRDVSELKTDIAAVSSPKSMMIPGFRSRKWWKMLIAVMGYAFILAVVSGLETDSARAHHGMLYVDRAALLISMLFPVALACNYLGIDDRLPFAERADGRISVLGVILWSVLGFFLCMLMSVLAEQIFFI